MRADRGRRVRAAEIFPRLARTGARLKMGKHSQRIQWSGCGEEIPIEQSTTETERILEDPEVNAVVIATRHDTHGSLVVRALEAGKSVFVEKPLCLKPEELERIAEAHGRANGAGRQRPILMVGYNRRFAPLTQTLLSQVAGRKSPLAMIFTCNAGAIPGSHWVQDPAAGGGRILGEACHFIDLLHYVAGEAEIEEVAALKHGLDGAGNLGDTAAITLRFADGSLGQVNYFANGPRSFPKERLEVFWDEKAVRIDNFRKLRGFGCRGGKRCWKQDKGHEAEVRAFVEALRGGGESPIRFESLMNTTRATFAVVEAMEGKCVVALGKSGHTPSASVASRQVA